MPGIANVFMARATVSSIVAAEMGGFALAATQGVEAAASAAMQNAAARAPANERNEIIG